MILGGIDDEPTPTREESMRRACWAMVCFLFVAGVVAVFVYFTSPAKPEPEQKRKPPVGGVEHIRLGDRGAGGAVGDSVLAVSHALSHTPNDPPGA